MAGWVHAGLKCSGYWQAYVLRTRTTLAEFVKRAAAFGPIRHSCVVWAGGTVLGLWCATHAVLAQSGSASDPDLQVNGFAVFGTNVAGATTVTSGWGSVYMDGSLQVHSNLHVDGSIVSTNLVQMSRQGLSQRDQWLANGATIQPVSSYIRVRGDGSSVTLGSPQIAAGVPGQLLTLQGVSSTYKVMLINGEGVRTMLQQPFSLGEFDTIQLIFDDSSSSWVEINRSQNRWSN